MRWDPRAKTLRWGSLILGDTERQRPPRRPATPSRDGRISRRPRGGLGWAAVDQNRRSEHLADCCGWRHAPDGYRFKPGNRGRPLSLGDLEEPANGRADDLARSGVVDRGPGFDRCP